MKGSEQDSYARNRARVTELEARRAKIRSLNDLLRSGRASGYVVYTPGIKALGHEALLELAGAIATFTDFNDDNDAHQEHDFGAIEFHGSRVFWKIDYYDLQLEYGSPDPADPDVTARVLTIMLAEEY
jgi:hypothetical protein